MMWVCPWRVSYELLTSRTEAVKRYRTNAAVVGVAGKAAIGYYCVAGHSAIVWRSDRLREGQGTVAHVIVRTCAEGYTRGRKRSASLSWKRNQNIARALNIEKQIITHGNGL